jgi:predicted RNase H-like HicB family nuclease
MTSAGFNEMGRSYYIFCIEQALANVKRARELVAGDKVEINHQLPELQLLLEQALDAS